MQEVDIKLKNRSQYYHNSQDFVNFPKTVKINYTSFSIVFV